MSAAALSVLFGLASALTWGGGDFCGGLASRRAPLARVLVVGELSGALLLPLLALAFGERWLTPGEVGWAYLAGLGGLVGIAALYRGLSTGSAAVVAPVSAVLAAGLPVLYGATTEGLPGPQRLLGFGLALLGVWLLAGGSGTAGRAGLGLAILAGCGFASFFIVIRFASATATFWPLLVARLAALSFTLPLLLLRRRTTAPLGAGGWFALASGILDAGGNVFYVLALRAGRLDVAAVLASLYPLSTVVLARLISAERVAPRQSAGMACTLLAIGLIAA